MLVLLTDGKQTQDPRKGVVKPGTNAEGLKEKGVTIYTIGIGAADPLELLAIASSSRGVIPAQFETLVDVADKIVKQYCKGKTL